MRKGLEKIFLYALVFVIAASFVLKFGVPQLLRAYVQTGIGTCTRIPILCMAPKEVMPDFKIDETYLQGLIPFRFDAPKTEISVPKGFGVVQELIKKPFYKKRKPRRNTPVIYIIHQPPGYFINLFPQIKKTGVNDNYEFMRRLLHAQETNISNINDAFFVILKSIFTPDLGNQKDVRMIQFKDEGKDYFINYNLSGQANLFDCSIVTAKDEFFKIYIKDTAKMLDLSKVFTIISTARNP